MTAIGYMPLLKAGATLYSAVVIHSRMFQSSSFTSSLHAIYGQDIKNHAMSLLGSGVGEAAKRIFGPTASQRQVLEQHTLFGAYSRAMAPQVASTLAGQLIAGNGGKFRSAFRGHRGRQIPRLATTCMRSCEKCIAEDISLQGFASWHVLHLLPSIGHCPYHGEPLRDEAKRERAGGLLPLSLPGERPSTVTSIEAMNLPVSDGYAAYLRLWIEAFEGNLTGIAPDLWMLVMDAVVRRFGTIAHASEKISGTIQKSWGVPLVEVASALGIADGPLFVQAELEQRVQASYVASRLVICGALDELKISPPRCDSSPWHSPLELAPVAPFGSWLTPQTQAELRRLVIDANFPPALFRTMTEDLDIHEVDERLHLNHLVLGKFFQTLPDELLDRMSKEQSWDRSSWLKKEIRRREVAWSLSERQ